MTQSITQPYRFKFADQGIFPKLLEYGQPGVTGYWQFQFDRLSEREQPFYWHLAVNEGNILYSGGRKWTDKTLLSVLQRYLPQTRQDPIKSQFALLKQEIHNDTIAPDRLWQQIKSLDIANDDQLRAALRLKILNDLDTYLLLGAGEAKLISDRELTTQVPITGFSLSSLMEASNRRLIQWAKLKDFVPSMDVVPILDRVALAKANLSSAQKQRIEDLVKSEKTLNQLAYGMAKDNLEVAQMFGKLIEAGLLRLRSTGSNLPPTVMIVDDSPVVLSQFQHWLTVLGYPVVVCQDAEIALSMILQVKPATIFIDINMPNISGFELVKQVRQRPEIATTPLAILTGEQKLSNKWRAQWSGCEFLTKPLSMSEISSFQEELPQVLQRLLADNYSISMGASSIS